MNPHATPPPPEGEEPDPLLAALRQRLHQYGEEPAPATWAAIRQRLPAPPRPLPWWRRSRYGRSALLLLLGCVLLGTGLLLRYATPLFRPLATPSAAGVPAPPAPAVATGSRGGAGHLARPAIGTTSNPAATGGHGPVAATEGYVSALATEEAGKSSSRTASAPPAVGQAARIAPPTTLAPAGHQLPTVPETAAHLPLPGPGAKRHHPLPPVAVTGPPIAEGKDEGRASKAATETLKPNPVVKSLIQGRASKAVTETGRRANGSASLRQVGRQENGRQGVGLKTQTVAGRRPADTTALAGAARYGHPGATQAVSLAAASRSAHRQQEGRPATKAAQHPYEARLLALLAPARRGAAPRVPTATGATAGAEAAAAKAAARRGASARGPREATTTDGATARRYPRLQTAGANAGALAPAAADPASSPADPAGAANRAIVASRAEVLPLALRLPSLPWPVPAAAPANPKAIDSLQQLPPNRRWSVLVLAGPALSYRRLGGPDTSRRNPNFARLERPAPALGAQVQVRRVLAGRWALAAGLGYQEYATRLALTVQGQADTFSVHRRDTYRLLTVPVQLGYRISPVGGRWALAGLAGADAGWLWQARTTEGSSCSCQQQTYSGASVAPYARFSLALSLGLEARYRLGGPAGRWHWVLQPTGRYVVSRFVPPNYLGFVPRQPFSLGLLTGVAWDVR